MAEDILHSRRVELSNNLDFDQNIFDEALFVLNKEVESLSDKSIEDFGFTLQLNFNLNTTINTEYIKKQTITITNFYKSFKMNIARILNKQKNVYDIILSSINSNERKIFLGAPGSTGKIFLINLLLAKVRFDRKIDLAVASSGIAATRLVSLLFLSLLYLLIILRRMYMHMKCLSVSTSTIQL